MLNVANISVTYPSWFIVRRVFIHEHHTRFSQIYDSDSWLLSQELIILKLFTFDDFVKSVIELCNLFTTTARVYFQIALQTILTYRLHFNIQLSQRSDCNMCTFKRNKIGNTKNEYYSHNTKYQLLFDVSNNFSVFNVGDENFFRVAYKESVRVRFIKHPVFFCAIRIFLVHS